MKRLNSRYRAKPKTTDVLSFPQDNTLLLGDIVISLPRAIVQAKEYEVTVAEEVTRLLIHGTLHLLGYDHENVSARKARAMVQEEDRLMAVVKGRKSF